MDPITIHLLIICGTILLVAYWVIEAVREDNYKLRYENLLWRLHNEDRKAG